MENFFLDQVADSGGASAADQGLAEPQGAYIPKSTLLVEFRVAGRRVELRTL